jgi:hypothetical protein
VWFPVSDPSSAAWLEAEADPKGSAAEELVQTREALVDSQLRLHELEEKLAVEEDLSKRQSALPPPKP